jgi:hypothetical protein
MRRFIEDIEDLLMERVKVIPGESWEDFAARLNLTVEHLDRLAWAHGFKNSSEMKRKIEPSSLKPALLSKTLRGLHRRVGRRR